MKILNLNRFFSHIIIIAQIVPISGEYIVLVADSFVMGCDFIAHIIKLTIVVVSLLYALVSQVSVHSFYASKKFLEFNRRTSEKSLKVHVDWL